MADEKQAVIRVEEFEGGNAFTLLKVILPSGRHGAFDTRSGGSEFHYFMEADGAEVEALRDDLDGGLARAVMALIEEWCSCDVEHLCVNCRQWVTDRREEAGATSVAWATKDGDYGCEESPDTLREGPDAGVGAHAMALDTDPLRDCPLHGGGDMDIVEAVAWVQSVIRAVLPIIAKTHRHELGASEWVTRALAKYAPPVVEASEPPGQEGRL